MSLVELPSCPIHGLHMVEITPQLEPELQRFYEANPLHFIAVNGEPECPNEAHEETESGPPAQ